MLTVALLAAFPVVALKNQATSFDGCVTIVLLSITTAGNVLITYYVCSTPLQILAK